VARVLSETERAMRLPLEFKRGKTYIGIKCPKVGCGHKLMLVELPSASSSADESLIAGLRVVCPMCQTETVCEARQAVVYLRTC
jgi:hypothetical protein